MRRILLAVLLIVSLVTGGYSLCAAGDYQARSTVSPSPAVMAADGLVGRPVGIAATAAGVGVFVATLPFTLVSGSTESAARELVGGPAVWTFGRPIGKTGKERHFFLP